MALSRLAGKLRIPAAAALRPRVLPEEPSRLLASRFFSQGSKSSQPTMYRYGKEDLADRRKQMREEIDSVYQARMKYMQLSRSWGRFPMYLLLTYAGTVVVGFIFLSYVSGALDDSMEFED